MTWTSLGSISSLPQKVSGRVQVLFQSWGHGGRGLKGAVGGHASFRLTRAGPTQLTSSLFSQSVSEQAAGRSVSGRLGLHSESPPPTSAFLRPHCLGAVGSMRSESLTPESRCP